MDGKAPLTGSGNSVTAPSVVIRPIVSVFISVNHSAPSAPAAMPNGPLSGVGVGNEVAVAVRGDPADAVVPVAGEPQRAVRCRW